MKNRPFPEIPCVICSTPVASSADLSADEKGKAVHTPLGHDYPEFGDDRRGALLFARHRRAEAQGKPSGVPPSTR
jgi:hypothetical protein